MLRCKIEKFLFESSLRLVSNKIKNISNTTEQEHDTSEGHDINRDMSKQGHNITETQHNRDRTKQGRDIFRDTT